MTQAAALRLRFGSRLTAIGLAAALAGCDAPPPEYYASAGRPGGGSATAVPIGKNQAGEPCRYQLIAGGGSIAGREATIYCGNWDQPSGRVFDLAEGTDQGRLQALATSGAWRADIEKRFACGAPMPTTILGGSPAQLMQCSRRVGGWPHVAVTVAIGGHIYGGDAVQPALSALEATLAALTGQGGATTAAQTTSEAQRLIASRAGGGSFGSGDEGSYFQKTRLGDAYNNIDDAADAERAYRDALAIQQKVLGPDDPGLALTMMKLAAQIAHQRSGPEAGQLLEKAGQLTAKSGDTLLAAQLDYYRAITLAYGGGTEEALGLAERAENAFSRLVPEAAQTPRETIRHNTKFISAGTLETLVGGASSVATPERASVSGLAEAMRLRATLLQQLGRTRESVDLTRRAQEILVANNLTVSSTSARSLSLLAGNAVLEKKYLQAASLSSDAERVFQKVTPGERPEALNLLREGYYRLKDGDVSGALASFRKAGAILNSPTVNGGARPEAIVSWLDALEKSGGNKAGLAEEMFGVAQFARSSLTAQAIAQATARLVAGDPKVAEALLGYEDRKRAFEQLQTERDQAVATGAGADRLAALDQRIEEARKARDEAEAVILERAPDYVKSGEKPVTVGEARSSLAPDEAFMFYFVADSGSYGFIIRPNSIVSFPIPLNRAEIARIIDRLRATTIAKPNGLPTLDFAASYRLYQALFGPVEDQLQGVNRVTIAAAGDLLRYPLEALVTQPGASDNDGDYRKVPFLVRRFALTYVPSPRVFVNLRHGQTAQPGLKPFIGFGDFQPGTTAQLAASFPPSRCADDYQRLSQGLVRLPETRDQVVAIARELGAGPGDVVLGPAFDKARLASPDLAQYRIVLFATHAFLQESLRCFAEAAAITVSVSPRAPNADGEFEGISDIEKMKLNADLVALSACDTSGAGGVGESLSGLARAFFLRGARGLLVTHWTVVTGASVPLMIGTFSAGGGTRDSAQALRTAQLNMIDTAGSSEQKPIEISHPNYWSAFVLIGDGVRAPARNAAGMWPRQG